MSKDEIKFQRRKEAVDAIQRGEPIKAVSRVMNIPMRTLFHWLYRYRHGGWHALKEGKREGRPRKLSPEIMRWLYGAITLGDPRQFQFSFCLWTLSVIRTLLKKEHGIELSKSAISRLLKHLGLSPQRPIYRSYRKDPKQLERYLNKTFPELRALAKARGAEIYFVDEAAVRSDSHHGTTWGAVGETPEVPDTGDRFTLKLISAVSPRGNMRFSFIEGKMTAAKFIEFLEKLHRDAGRPIIVITDRAAYHTAKKVQSFLDQKGSSMTMETLPAYAPELNPDEQVWNHLKRRLEKTFFKGKIEMKRLTLNILRSIQKTKTLVRSFFRLKETSYAAL